MFNIMDTLTSALEILKPIALCVLPFLFIGEVETPPVPPPTDWRTTIIPEDVRADPIFEKYKEPGEAMRALVHAQKFMGREHLPVPKDANDKDAFSMIFKRLGLPENDEGYIIPTDIEIPKDLLLDEGMLKDFRKVAHEHGILPSQFSGVYKWYMNNVIKQYDDMNKQNQSSAQEAETSLRKEWGAAYQQNFALATKVMKTFIDEKSYAELQKGLGNNPAMIRFLANIGKAMSEDQLSGKPQGLTLTPTEAQAEINKIKNDPKHPYWNAGDPNHTEAVEAMERLMKFITV